MNKELELELVSRLNHILRNQNLIMGALANISENVGGMAHVYWATELRERMRELGRRWPDAIPPNERKE